MWTRLNHHRIPMYAVLFVVFVNVGDGQHVLSETSGCRPSHYLP